MNKSLISSIAAATLVGSIGLVYAQSQGTDTTSQPATPADTTTQSATSDSSTAAPSTSSSSMDTSTPSSSASPTDSSLAAQADRN